MFSKLFFDKQDHDLLSLINRILEKNSHKTKSGHFFSPDLHPHGIKELAVSRELKIAYSVMNLLSSLEAGEATDRILALQSLHEEVLYTAASNFRRNTGRVLIQIMKDLIRAYGNKPRQLELAHDFRESATGKPRIVRAMLKRYHLLEMPETWDQLTFDNHVHDANTKGRKSPTHLIMDAWIKGIRSLTVIYYNFIEPRAVQELVQAAEIVDINIRVGIEYRAVHRNKFIEFIWEPIGMLDAESIASFLAEDGMRQLMQEGRAISAYRTKYIFSILERYNQVHRITIGEKFGISLPEITENEFKLFVAAGQPSLLHLAEMTYHKALPLLAAWMPELKHKYKIGTAEEKNSIKQTIENLKAFSPEFIMETYFSIEKNSDLPNPDIPSGDPDIPEHLLLSPKQLLYKLAATRSLSRTTLTISGLTVEDVLELLYDGEGKITHLEIFNLKDYAAGKTPYCKSISALQYAINKGSAIVLKKTIRQIIENYKESAALDMEERVKCLRNILQNIGRLQSFYKKTPLKTRMGSDSTSRSYRLHGMGLVFTKTLPKTSQKIISDPKDKLRQIIPFKADTDSKYIFSTPKLEYSRITQSLLKGIRKLPLCQYVGINKEHSWSVRSESTQYTNTSGEIATLGGIQREASTSFSLREQKKNKQNLSLNYMNNRLANFLKVFVGLALTMLTFYYTQTWWVLIWFGALIWFGITGIRNILQSVLGGGGFNRTPLLKWNDYVSWSRICDSLLYTGISVPLLELILRWWILESIFSINTTTHAFLFFTISSLTNSVYIAAHNLYRGLQKEAIIGNIFRSILAIPLAVVYNAMLLWLILFFGDESMLPVLAASGAIISKASSDTVAGVIEGIADQNTSLRMRSWDYKHKITQLFSCYAKLEVLLPEEDVMELIKNDSKQDNGYSLEVSSLLNTLTIHSLDLMYFWMYQPRARTLMRRRMSIITQDEKKIFSQSQLILTKERFVSQLLVDGAIGNNFSKALAFFLDSNVEYLKDLEKLTGIPLDISKA